MLIKNKNIYGKEKKNQKNCLIKKIFIQVTVKKKKKEIQ